MKKHTPQASQEDDDIIEKADSHRAAFKALYRKYFQAVYRYFLKRLGHRTHDAEDLAQETFVRAYEKLNTYRPRGYSYFSYLLRIAHNLLANHFRSMPAIEPLENVLDIVSEDTSAEDILSAKLAFETLRADIGSLPQKDRIIIGMRYQKELDIKRIAEATRSTPGAVKVRLSRIRARLKALHDAGRPHAPRI
jgi:RNA polymerase sigma-70 factor (ECF subfamily)